MNNTLKDRHTYISIKDEQLSKIGTFTSVLKMNNTLQDWHTYICIKDEQHSKRPAHLHQY